MKKDIDIHEALDLAKRLLKTTRVRVAVGKPLFSCADKPFVGTEFLKGIYVLERFSAYRASNFDHAIWTCVGVGDTWGSALDGLEERMKTVESIIACRERDLADGVKP